MMKPIHSILIFGVLFATQFAQAGIITGIVKYSDRAGHAIAKGITPPAVKPVIGPITSGVDKSGHNVARGLNVAVKFLAKKVIW
jgi:hypothetical protein